MTGGSATNVKVGSLGLLIAFAVLTLMAAIGGSASAATLLPGAASGRTDMLPLSTPPAIAPLAPAATSEPSSSPPVASPGDGGTPAPIPGEWSVTYGSPAVVTITVANGSYSVTAKTRVQVTGSSCFLPPGTLIATFSASGRSFTGEHGLWLRSNCSFVRWTPVTITMAGTGLAATLGDGEHVAFTRLGDLPALPFRESVPTPAQISFDPIVVAQSVAIAAGIVILVPFPAILFNRTLEENSVEIAERLRRARRRLQAALLGLVAVPAQRRLARFRAVPLGASARAEGSPNAIQTDPDPGHTPGSGFWGTPLGLLLFLLLSGLLYGFLDPTFGPDVQSVAAFAGLVLGLAVTLLAFWLPVEFAYRQTTIPHTLQALPVGLLVGIACVLITRFTGFQPGYLYGLVITFVVARELTIPTEGRAMMRAAASAFVMAAVSWLGLWAVDVVVPAQGNPGPALIVLQNALTTVLVAGVELTVFGMLPLRFLPGEKVFRWSRRGWAAVFGMGLFGLVYVLMNPRSGQLADTNRTPIITIVVLLLGFGLFSVLFWGYFRFRRAPVP